MIAARVGAFAALLGALVFASAAVALMRSADPVTAFVPLCVAGFMGVCACELWKGPGGGVSRSTAVENRSRAREAASARTVDV